MAKSCVNNVEVVYLSRPRACLPNARSATVVGTAGIGLYPGVLGHHRGGALVAPRHFDIGPRTSGMKAKPAFRIVRIGPRSGSAPIARRSRSFSSRRSPNQTRKVSRSRKKPPAANKAGISPSRGLLPAGIFYAVMSRLSRSGRPARSRRRARCGSDRSRGRSSAISEAGRYARRPCARRYRCRAPRRCRAAARG